MALCLTVPSDQLTLVHGSDPDVTLPDGKSGWVPVADAHEVREGATRVVVRPLTGREMLAAYASRDRADQLFAICKAGVVAIDSVPTSEQALLALDWLALSSLGSTIEDISTGFTKPLRS